MFDGWLVVIFCYLAGTLACLDLMLDTGMKQGEEGDEKVAYVDEVELAIDDGEEEEEDVEKGM